MDDPYDTPKDYYSHSDLEQIKFKPTIEGDLGATLLNIMAMAAKANNGKLPLYCDHTAPKLDKFIRDLDDALDPANKIEK